MATVSAKMLSPSGSNLSTSKTIDTEKRTRLTVTRNSNPWIYSNYPEAIGKNGKGLALAENGYFLNQLDYLWHGGSLLLPHKLHWKETLCGHTGV